MITVGSDFSGVGAFDQALIRLGIEYKTVFACDMDKYARQTFIHNYGEPDYYPENVYDREITKDSLSIYMTSPPCQAFSLAGKRLGKEDKRGILFFNSHEFIQENKPRFFIFENVKGLLSDDNGRTFQEWINYLGGKSVNGVPVIFPTDEAVPYHIYWKVLNAKKLGVPQNRERVFIVGIREDEDNFFDWPNEVHLTKKLKDVLETDVDEKYFLSETAVNWMISHREKRDSKNEFPYTEKSDSVGTITARYYKSGAEDVYFGEKVKIGTWRTHEDGKGFRKTEDNNCPTIPARAREDGSGQPVIMIPSATSKGFELATENDSINFSVLNSKTRRGRVGKEVAQTLDTACNQGVCIPVLTPDRAEKRQNGRRFKDDGEEMFTITTQDRHGIYDGFKIRRLTPRECFRLMDFPDTFYETINFNNIINSQGVLLSLQNKKDIKWNAKELDVIEKQKLKECVCSIIKDGTNTVMKILNLNTHTEVNQNAQLKIAVEVFTAKDIVQNTTILIENGEILYLAKTNNLKLLKKQDNELLILEEKFVLEEKGNLCTDYYLKFILEENLKQVSASTILTTIQTITNCLTYIYSIPKENTISVILSYKNYQNNFLKGELLNLKMGNTILSDSQLYKQAGNSIVVKCLELIIKGIKPLNH